MRRHAKASSAASSSGGRNPLRTFSLGFLVGLIAVLAMSSSSFASITHPYTGVSFGPDGTEGTAFGRVQSVAIDPSTEDVYVYDGGEGGKIYKFDAAGSPVNFSALPGNAIEAGGGTTGAAENQIAIAPPGSPGGSAGDIYVANAHGVRVYNQGGTQIGELTGGETCGVATDPAGHIFVGVYPNEVREYVPSANPPTNADQSGVSAGVVEQVCNVAADGLGNVYAANYFGGVQKLEGLGAPSASLIDPSGRTLGIDPATNDLYADRESEIRQYDSAGKLLGSFGAGQLSGSRGVAVNGSSEEVYVGNAATNRVEVFGPAAPVPAQIVDEAVTSVDLREALLRVRINPNGNPTTYHVEYGLDTSYSNSTDEEEVGADETVHTVTTHLTGLAPGTTYHYRYVVSNAIGVVTGPDRAFTTTSPSTLETECPNQQFRVGASARLPDCRAYEMVSPIEKNNTDINWLINLNNALVRLNQSSADGEKFTYTTSQGFGDTGGTPYSSQYLATRSASGWSTDSITPSQGIARQAVGNRIDLEYQVFSDDLCVGLLDHYTDPPLAPGATEGGPNAYRRTNCGQPQYETVSTVLPASGNEGSPLISGLSADARCAVYRPDGYPGLYENCAGQLQQVNILPNGEAGSVATAGTSTGGGREFTLRQGSYQGAVSADGSRIYWTSRLETGPLYLRENAQAPQSALGPSNECLEPDKACTIPVSDEAADAYFWGASPDGARAFYTVGGFGGGEQKLYEFNLDTETSTLITSELMGVMGVNQEATRIYFLSRGEISGHGDAGKPNLYLFDATKSGSAQFQYIGTVTGDDTYSIALSGLRRLSLADPRPDHRVARLSADGLRAVFAARAPLTGYDNTDAVSGERDFEVFVYDALGNGEEGSLHCISCNPTGQRPVGRNVEVEQNAMRDPNWAAALVPGQDTSFNASRAISDDGSHVFFNSYDSLLPADTNGKEDVYEWQAPGSEAGPGKCTEESSSFSPPNGGCLSLISSGESPSDSEFLDASPTGRDVFFTTAASLLPQDPGLIDIYDARAGGGYPPPPIRAAACEGEACQGAYAPPNDPTPASSSFDGAGNVHETSSGRCAKGKARRKGRCVAKKSKHAKKGRAHRTAKHNGRAAR